ncbi:MAG: efflux RND transporter periplasmic adaptor subunit [Gammaproteobacteria bacterium]|nr:efflux RND transporter periplasmic adaptor subunit [Gammaproteobacteria bacterium]
MRAFERFRSVSHSDLVGRGPKRARPDLRLGLASLLIAAMSPAHGLPTLDCVIKPYVTVELGSPVEGVIEEIAVQRNDLITRGQVLARLKSDVEQATVSLAKARAGLDGAVDARRAALEFGKRKQARTDELYEKKAVPFHVKDEAETDARIARLKLVEAEENKLVARLELQRAVELLNQRTIPSPIDGVVVERMMAPGEFVDDKPLLELAQLDPLRVEVILPVTMYGSIEEGMRAVVEPELPGSRRYLATVSSVDRVLDGSSGTFGARLLLPNPDYALPGGLRCRLRPLEKGELPPAGAVDATTAPLTPLEKAKPLAVPPTANVARSEPVQQAPSVKHVAPMEKAPEQPSPEPVASAAVNTPQPRVCGTVGPIKTVAQTNQLSEALAGKATQISRRVAKSARIARYLVLTPEKQSLADAKRLAHELNRQGVQHLRAIPRGPYAGHVSLGLFLTKANAEKHRDSLASQGIEAILKTRYREQQQTWLDLEFSDRNQNAISQVLREAGRGLSLTRRDCPMLKTAQK